MWGRNKQREEKKSQRDGDAAPQTREERRKSLCSFLCWQIGAGSSVRGGGRMSRLQKELFTRGEVAQLQDGGSNRVLMSFGGFTPAPSGIGNVPVHLPAVTGTGDRFAGWLREAEEREQSWSTAGFRCAHLGSSPCCLGTSLILVCIAPTPSKTRLLCAEALCPEELRVQTGRQLEVGSGNRCTEKGNYFPRAHRVSQCPNQIQNPLPRPQHLLLFHVLTPIYSVGFPL